MQYPTFDEYPTLFAVPDAMVLSVPLFGRLDDEQLMNPYSVLLCAYVRDLQGDDIVNTELMRILCPTDEVPIDDCMIGTFLFGRCCDVVSVVRWIGNVNQRAIEALTLLSDLPVRPDNPTPNPSDLRYSSRTS